MCDNKSIFSFSKAWESIVQNAVLSNLCLVVCQGPLPDMNV